MKSITFKVFLKGIECKVEVVKEMHRRKQLCMSNLFGAEVTLISDESQKLAIDGELGHSVDVARETMSISSCMKTLQCEF